MVGYLCATPYHIMAAITMASGMFKAEKSTIIIMDHMSDAEELSQRVRSTGIFEDVILYRNNRRTKSNTLKHFWYLLSPAKLIRRQAWQTKYTRFICFALNFADLSYVIKAYQSRGLYCEFAFGDDGIGTYVDSNCYKPRKIVRFILWIHRRLSLLDHVKRLYVYKPKYMFENQAYEVIPIQQNKESIEELKRAVRQIWPLDIDPKLIQSVLYLEQPNRRTAAKNSHNNEKQLLTLAASKLNLPIFIKIHPRTLCQTWDTHFSVLKSKLPFEALIIQEEQPPILMMTVNSTAPFSQYLIDALPQTACHIVLLRNLLYKENNSASDTIEKFCKCLNAHEENSPVYIPNSIKEFETFLECLNK